jgi:hypothetical protein
VSAVESVLSQKTDVPQVVVLPVDPLNGPTAMLLPFIAHRIFTMAGERMSELDPERFTRTILARLWSGDPGVLVLAFLEPSGKLVGHVVAEICTDNVKRWIFVSQTKADGNVGDAVKRTILMLDEWAKQFSATTMCFATHRSDAAWQKKYGFEPHRQVMMRAIGSEIGQPKE